MTAGGPPPGAYKEMQRASATLRTVADTLDQLGCPGQASECRTRANSLENANPMATVAENEPPQLDQTQRHLEYLATLDNAPTEVYWWDYAEVFLMVPLAERRRREDTDE